MGYIILDIITAIYLLDRFHMTISFCWQTTRSQSREWRWCTDQIGNCTERSVVKHAIVLLDVDFVDRNLA